MAVTSPDKPLIAERDEPEPLSMIAGYRVMRKLGSSGRADVYLGHARAQLGAQGDRSGSVALKVFRPDANADSIEREIRALSAIQAGRLAELIDLATLPDGRVCLVLERLAGGSLSQHLREHERLEKGEAVTILAPVIAALAGLHAAGLVHGGLSQSSVIFDARGRPVLTGLGALRELPSPAAVGRQALGATRRELLRDNYARLTMLMRSVFDHLDPEEAVARRAEEVAAWFEVATAEVPFRPCLDVLERRLFELAPAKPVRLDGAVADDGEVGAAGWVDGARLRREALSASSSGFDTYSADAYTADALEQQADDRVPRWFEIFHLPPEIRAAVLRVRGDRPVQRLRSRVRERLHAKRRPLLVAGFVSASVIVLALTLLPAQDGSSKPGTGKHDASMTNTESTAAAVQGRVSRSATDTGALEGDDPLLAVPVLLRIRAECLAAASVVCLDGVDQVGSATMAADSYSVRMTQQGGNRSGEPDYASHPASVVERTGNSALVALAAHSDGEGAEGQPASVLVVKGEAGWRLREIFDY